MSFQKVCQLANEFKSKLIDVDKKSNNARQLMPGEGDNVDKAGDLRQAILAHLDAIVPLVDDGQLEQAEVHAKAIENLAQAFQFLLREMDVENG